MENRTGKRIFNLRIKNKLSQKDLSDKSGIDRVSICQFETGIKIPTIPTLEKLCKGLNIDVWKFFKEW